MDGMIIQTTTDSVIITYPNGEQIIYRKDDFENENHISRKENNE